MYRYWHQGNVHDTSYKKKQVTEYVYSLEEREGEIREGRGKKECEKTRDENRIGETEMGRKRDSGKSMENINIYLCMYVSLYENKENGILQMMILTLSTQGHELKEGRQSYYKFYFKL
jgi:hypothetical protein